MRYPSGKSLGFGILLWGVILILIISTTIVPEQYRWMVLLGTILCSLLLLWIWFGTFYKFKDKYLLVRMGPFFERIPYNKITSARKFRSMASSMALSSDMIELRHGI
ncbi:MAG: PH domain-containing protein [Chloroflexi bacterium]|nr:PH domain-containing protein [Chloroflexota bacterium]